MEQLELLVKMVGREKAEELVKEIQKADRYFGRFKRKVNKLLSEHGHEVLVGIKFVEKQTVTNGEHLNDTTN
jgi:hypothetical protein